MNSFGEREASVSRRRPSTFVAKTQTFANGFKTYSVGGPSYVMEYETVSRADTADTSRIDRRNEMYEELLHGGQHGDREA